MRPGSSRTSALGISDCYISPFFKTTADAYHGLHVSDHKRFRGHRRDELADRLGPSHTGVLELQALTTWFAALAPPSNHDREPQTGRPPDKTAGVERLAALLQQSTEVKAFLDETICHFNG